MPKLPISAALLSAFLAGALPAAAQDQAAGAKIEPRACPGVALSRFEGRFPKQVQRYPFDHAMLKPLLELWHAGRRPDLPMRPERVTVYELPGKPFLLGYQSGDCVIAFLSVERRRFWHWLRLRIGWSV